MRVGAGDNETLLNAMASDATKEEHVHFHHKALIDGGKNAMHLRFLAAMCACGDRGISRHQDLVLPYLLSNQSKILLEVTVVRVVVVRVVVVTDVVVVRVVTVVTVVRVVVVVLVVESIFSILWHMLSVHCSTSVGAPTSLNR